jgi:hypothetical protein
MNTLAKTTERSLSLYELLELQKLAEASDTPEGLAAFSDSVRADIQSGIEAKIERIYQFKSSLEATKIQIAAEKKRLTEKNQWIDSILQRLKEIVKTALTKHDIRRVSGRTVSISLKPAAGAVKITDQDKIPAEFRRITVTLALDTWSDIIAELSKSDFDLGEILADVVKKGDMVYDKAGIQKAIKEGRQVDGADLDVSNTSLTIA